MHFRALFVKVIGAFPNATASRGLDLGLNVNRDAIGRTGGRVSTSLDINYKLEQSGGLRYVGSGSVHEISLY